MFKTKDLVCVVMNYNAEEYLEECLESIINQETRFSFDIVIIDDCSDDNSKNIFLQIKKKYKLKNIYFFSTVKNTNNAWGGGGIKKILELQNEVKHLLKARYIYRINSDDYIIDKNKFEKQIIFLEKNRNLIGVSSKYKILKNNILKNNQEEVLTGFIKPSLIIKNIFFRKYFLYNHTTTYIYRNIYKSMVPPLMLNFPFIWGDTLYNFILINNGSIFVFNEYMSVYRVNDKGVWSSFSKKRKSFLNKILLFKIFFVINFRLKLIFLYNLVMYNLKMILGLFNEKIKKLYYIFKKY